MVGDLVEQLAVAHLRVAADLVEAHVLPQHVYVHLGEERGRMTCTISGSKQESGKELDKERRSSKDLISVKDFIEKNTYINSRDMHLVKLNQKTFRKVCLQNSTYFRY